MEKINSKEVFIFYLIVIFLFFLFFCFLFFLFHFFPSLFLLFSLTLRSSIVHNTFVCIVWYSSWFNIINEWYWVLVLRFFFPFSLVDITYIDVLFQKSFAYCYLKNTLTNCESTRCSKWDCLSFLIILLFFFLYSSTTVSIHFVRSTELVFFFFFFGFQCSNAIESVRLYVYDMLTDREEIFNLICVEVPFFLLLLQFNDESESYNIFTHTIKHQKHSFSFTALNVMFVAAMQRDSTYLYVWNISLLCFFRKCDVRRVGKTNTKWNLRERGTKRLIVDCWCCWECSIQRPVRV